MSLKKQILRKIKLHSIFYTNKRYLISGVGIIELLLKLFRFDLMHQEERINENNWF